MASPSVSMLFAKQWGKKQKGCPHIWGFDDTRAFLNMKALFFPVYFSFLF